MSLPYFICLSHQFRVTPDILYIWVFLHCFMLYLINAAYAYFAKGGTIRVLRIFYMLLSNYLPHNM